MSSTEATQSDKYALVSSFYGPGVVGGWCLTVLACLVSVSLHPRKRTRDSITADLIAVLTLPAIAAADMIIRIRSSLKECSCTVLAQNAASIEATLTVTETFFAINVVFLQVSVGFKCMRRAYLLATVGLFCFSPGCYLFFSPSERQAIAQNLDMSFWIGLTAALLIYIIFALIFIAYSFLMRPHQPHARSSEQDVEARREDRERDSRQSKNAKALTLSFILPGVICGAYAQYWYSKVLNNLPSQFWPLIRTSASQLLSELIPTSNISVKELDQAVALLAGASVLGFSLYSTADAHYQAWLSKTRAETQQQGIELRTLNRNQAPGH